MSWKQELGRIVRFGITGTLSTLVHYGAYLLALLWVNATVAYTIGYGVGLCVNYVMTTFEEECCRIRGQSCGELPA